jgi:hypothetical protein
MQPRNLQPLFIRTAEYRGETQIDIRRIKKLSRYHRPPWKSVEEKEYNIRLSAFGPEMSSERYRTVMTTTLEVDYRKHVKIYTDGSNIGDKMGYAIVKEEHTIRKIFLPQNTVFSAEQSAIIGSTQSEKNNRHKKVITTDFLSTILAAESHTPTKNPKTQTIRKMLDNEKPRITPATKEYQVTKKSTR